MAQPVMRLLQPLGQPVVVGRFQYVQILSFNSESVTLLGNDRITYRRSGGTLAWRNLNPGNLKYGNFARSFGALGRGWGNHAIFPSYEAGAYAQEMLLFGNQSAYHNLSIIQAIARYAPSADGNQPRRYANFVAERAGVSVNTVLSQLGPVHRQRMLDAMRTFEGFREGQITRV
jgi:hypothetical protein